MTANDSAGDIVARAYARLVGLRKGLPDDKHVEVHERYVREFHSALDHLQGLGFKMDDFRVPTSEIRPRVEGGNYLTGEVDYSRDNYVDRSLLVAKLEAVMTYFEISGPAAAEPPKRRLGFQGPR